MNRISFFAGAAAFASGAGMTAHFGPFSAAPIPLACLTVLVAAAFPARRRWIALALVCALLGATRAATDRARIVARSARLPSGHAWFEGSVDGVVDRGRASYRFVLSTRGARIEVIALEASGSVAALPLPGDRARVWGRLAFGPTYRGPGVPDDSGRLHARGVDARMVTGADRVEVTGSGGPGVRRLASRWQRGVSASIARRGGDSAGNAVVRALAAGDRSAISAEHASQLRRAGVGHILAVSGLHLAVVGVILFSAVRRLWACWPALAGRLEPAAAAAIVALVAATAYTLVTGAQPSAMRALLVAAVVMIGLAVFRRVRALDALGFAALVLLVWRPGLLGDASFQMSFAAAIVLVLARPRHRGRRPEPSASRVRRWSRQLMRAVVALAAVSTWATAATAPTASHVFGEIAPIGIAVNIVALPLVELVILPLALVGALLSQLSLPLGGVALDISIAAAGLLVALASQVADLAPPLVVPPLGWLETVAVALALASALAWAAWARDGSLAAWMLIASAALAAIALALVFRGPSRPAGIRVTILDVGQGDAAVVEFPTGDVWLLDAGGRPLAGLPARGEAPGREAVLGYLRSRRIRRIDVAIVSHAHPDHYLGLRAVAAEVPIGALWLAGADDDQRRPVELDAIARWLQVLGTVLEAPPRFSSVGDARIHVLGPRAADGRVAVDPVSSINDNSLVIRLDYRGGRILFAGDLEEEGESLALAAGRESLDVDVVKVNHHGSRTSSTPAWVDATSPRLTVISCGRDNRFGFPAPEVLARWRAIGSRVLRTDRDGAITITVSPAGEIGVHTAVE